MSIETSDIIATAALVISFFSAYQTQKQNKTQQKDKKITFYRDIAKTIRALSSDMQQEEKLSIYDAIRDEMNISIYEDDGIFEDIDDGVYTIVNAQDRDSFLEHKEYVISEISKFTKSI